MSKETQDQENQPSTESKHYPVEENVYGQSEDEYPPQDKKS